MARPSKLTEGTMKRLTDAIRLGATYELACKYAGVTYQGFRNWIIEGETAREGSAAKELFDKVRAAEGSALVGWLAAIEKAARDGTWQAAAWKVERRYPNDYGNKIRVDVNIRREAERIAEEMGLSVDEVLAEAERIVKVEA